MASFSGVSGGRKSSALWQCCEIRLIWVVGSIWQWSFGILPAAIAALSQGDQVRHRAALRLGELQIDVIPGDMLCMVRSGFPL